VRVTKSDSPPSSKLSFSESFFLLLYFLVELSGFLNRLHSSEIFKLISFDRTFFFASEKEDSQQSHGKTHLVAPGDGRIGGQIVTRG